MSINYQESEMKSWHLIFIMGFSISAILLMELLFNSSPKPPQAIEKNSPRLDAYNFFSSLSAVVLVK